MSDSLYRIAQEALSEWESDVLAGAAAAGALVPVVRCEHGNVFPHSYVQTNMDGDAWEEIGCPGSPTLAEADDG